MRIQDLHDLPKFRDGLSYLYVERARVEQTLKAVEIIDQEGRTLLPVATLGLLMLGPGASITHEAVKTLTDNGCLLTWVGEQGVRCYAHGAGETRKGYRLLRQAALVCDEAARLAVVRRMYARRFGDPLAPDLTIEQLRGMEGARVRTAYATAARRFGVDWRGREYNRGLWRASDPANRALSAANACLNGLCHAAILSAGYSPGLGFIHTGKQLSFVYDIADLYKVALTVPIAFALAADARPAGGDGLESRVRQACRDRFHEARLLGRIIDDIDALLETPPALDEAEGEAEGAGEGDPDGDMALPSGLWGPDEEGGSVEGGVNYGGADS